MGSALDIGQIEKYVGKSNEAGLVFTPANDFRLAGQTIGPGDGLRPGLASLDSNVVRWCKHQVCVEMLEMLEMLDYAKDGRYDGDDRDDGDDTYRRVDMLEKVER